MSQSGVLDSLMTIIRGGILVADRDWQILRVNDLLLDMTGFDENALVGNTIDCLVDDESMATLVTVAPAIIAREGKFETDIWCRHKNSELRRFSMSQAVTTDDAINVEHHVVVLREIDAAGDKSSDLSKDALTGLPGRGLFEDRVAQSIIAANRSGKSLAILNLGIDGFTRINEGLTHQVGDQLLLLVAERLISCIRQSDTAARLGGDQFGLSLEITSIDDSVLVAEKVLKSLSSPFHVAGEEVILSASIGISLYPNDGDGPAGLIEEAHSAMRHGKKSGGNQYQFYANDMNDKAKSRIALEANLRRALDMQEFFLVYQPKVDVKTNRIKGMEALIRWVDSDGNFIGPGDFIPVAEETGLIVPIGNWVMREGARQNKEWMDKGYPPARLAVNVSGRQFMRPDFVETVIAALEESMLPPEWLELEITESLLMGDAEKTIRKLEAVRALGISLSIDDFGTGYSSLSYLSRFPITTLKIDRAFIYDLEHNRDTAEIARAIIGLSRGLELEVVAEGAENSHHINFLREQGCDLVQGFFYSRPLKAVDMEALLASGGYLEGEDQN